MQKKKISLANIQGKLSRAEMKNVIAGKAVCVSCNDNAGGVMCAPTTCKPSGGEAGNCIDCPKQTYCC